MKASTTVFENSSALKGGETYGDTIVHFRELESLLCGKIIGEGASRRVYVSQLDSSHVVKYERPGYYQNVFEWEIWNRVLGTKLEKWFAPCHMLSLHGMFLVQARVVPLPPNKYPTHVPAFIADRKLSNFGTYKGRVVCCDYGASTASLSENAKIVRLKWNK